MRVKLPIVHGLTNHLEVNETDNSDADEQQLSYEFELEGSFYLNPRL